MWNFQVKDHHIEAEVTLPIPTTRQLQGFCGEGTIMQFAPPILQWTFEVPENIILIPNQTLCTSFSDDCFVGLRVPVKTIDEKVCLTIS